MADKTKIQWSDATWNPITGCHKVSPGCKNCYAEAFTERFRDVAGHHFEKGFDLMLRPEMLDIPRKWKKPRRIFVNSLSDCFHKDIPIDFLQQIFAVMNECPQHTFQILTKREDVLLERAPLLNWTKNIWMGVSVENEDYVKRIEALRQVPAHVRFISAEPLLGSMGEVDLTEINWLICGGESGPNARPMRQIWVDELLCQCNFHGTSFFMKQMGSVWAKEHGCKDKKGGSPEDWPEWMRVREMPDA